MEYEQTFRFILILGFSVIVPIGAYHRIKSQATGEKLDRRQEGIFILVTSAVRGKLRQRTVSLYRSMSYGLFCPGTI